MRLLDRLRRSRALGWLLVAVLVLLWQAWEQSLAVPSPSIPSPLAIAERWIALIGDGQLLAQLASTLRVMLTGYLIGSALGILVGVLMGRIRTLWALLEPIVELLRPIPVAAAVPLLILFLGVGDSLKIVTVLAAAFFPVLINTFSGVRSVPGTLRDTARTFGLREWATVWEIVLPHSVPSILVGMRLALSISLVVTVFTEMISGNSGMGYFILSSQQSLTTIDLYVGVVTLALVGYLLNVLFLVLQARTISWHESGARRRGEKA